MESTETSHRFTGQGARIALGLVLFGGTLLIALSNWLNVGGGTFEMVVNGPLYDVVVLSTALACLLRASRGGPERAAWIVIGATILTEAATEFAWTIFYESDPTPPYPSLADIGWLAFYPMATLGLALMVRARAKALNWRLWTDGLIAALGTAALGAAFVFEFVTERTTGTPLEKAITLAYPLGDIFMLALVVGIIALSRWRPGRTWSLLLLGLAALVFADIASSMQASGFETVREDWVTPIYMLGAVCIGLEAWQHEAEPIRRTVRFDNWQELMVPGFFALVTICLFAIQYASTVSTLTAILSTATMLAIVIRLATSVLDNKRLLEAVRTDPLTGLGNQGGMQVDLARRCSNPEDGPATLMLLDLNGFKGFNDNFGHLAGDAMLTRLGAKLGASVAGYGSAYRIGGDEFAVLINDCDLDEVDAVAKRAAEALSDRGEDYELGAAWGSVSIPAEASTPATALQLADVRMYAQKQSRRIAHQDALRAPRGETTIRLRGPLDGKAVEQRH